MSRVVTVELPSNSTFPYRIATFVVVRKCPVTGVVEIAEAQTIKGKRTVSRYALREDTPVEGGRVFRFHKQDGSYYFVFLSPDGLNQCECRGFESKGRCKHTECLEKLDREGHL